MSSSATPSADNAFTTNPHPGKLGTDPGEVQEIQPIYSTSFEDLCLSRSSGLPIVKGLSPQDAVVFYYGEYQPEYDNKRSKKSRTVDGNLRYVSGEKEWQVEAGTDRQRSTPPIPSNPPQAGYKVVPLGAMTGATSTFIGKDPWLANERAYVQIIYIQTFAEREIKKLFDPFSDVEYSDQLFQTDATDMFVNTVRVRAGNRSHNIFVGLPYLGCGLETNGDIIPQDGIKNGLKLSCYRGIKGDAKEPDYGMRVWQSWQILFDNNRLALIKSPCSPSSNCAPLFAHQPTFGPFHALALNIGNQFRHEVKPLEVLHARVNDDISNIEAEISRYVLVEARQLTEEMMKSHGDAIKGTYARLERHLSNMKTITTVLGSQLTILRDLTTITTNHLNPLSRPAYGNPVPLPQFDGRGEQLRCARDVFKQLITERENVLADMDKLCVSVKMSQEELRGELRELRMSREQTQEKARRDALLNTLTKQEATSESINKTLEAQGDTTEQMKRIMARQGQALSVFTIISSTFLPLSFFTQYLSMNRDVLSTVRAHEEFWRVSGPITVFVILALIYFTYRDEGNIKLDILRIMPFARNKYQLQKKKIAMNSQQEKSTRTAEGLAPNENPSSETDQSTILIRKWPRKWLDRSKTKSSDEGTGDSDGNPHRGQENV